MKSTTLKFCASICLTTLLASCGTYNPRDDYKFIYTTTEGCGITQRDEAYIKKHEITSISWNGKCSEHNLAEGDGTYTENSKIGQFVQYKGKMYQGHFSYGDLKYATGWTLSGAFTNGGFAAGKIYENDRLVFKSKGCDGWCSSVLSSLNSGTHFLGSGYTIDGDFSINTLTGGKINYETGAGIINAQAKDPAGKFYVGWVESRRFNTLAAYDEASKDFNRRKEAAAEAARQKAEAEQQRLAAVFEEEQRQRAIKDRRELAEALGQFSSALSVQMSNNSNTSQPAGNMGRVGQQTKNSIVRVQALPLDQFADARRDDCIEFRLTNARAANGTVLEKNWDLLSINKCSHPVIVIGKSCTHVYADDERAKAMLLPVGTTLKAKIGGPIVAELGQYTLGPNAMRSPSGAVFGTYSGGTVRVENLVYAAFGPPYANQIGNAFGATAEFFPITLRLRKFEEKLSSLGWPHGHTASRVQNPPSMSCADIDLYNIWKNLR